MKRTFIKWLAVFCVLDCVGAATEPWSAELVAMEKRHAAELAAVRHEFYQQLQDVRQCSGCMSPSPPPPSPSPPPPCQSPAGLESCESECDDTYKTCKKACKKPNKKACTKDCKQARGTCKKTCKAFPKCPSPSPSPPPPSPSPPPPSPLYFIV